MRTIYLLNLDGLIVCPGALGLFGVVYYCKGNCVELMEDCSWCLGRWLDVFICLTCSITHFDHIARPAVRAGSRHTYMRCMHNCDFIMGRKDDIPWHREKGF